MGRRFLGRLAVVIGVACAMIGLGSVADAGIDGPCTGTLAGVDVGPLSASDPGDAIDVDGEEEIVATATAAGEISAYVVELEYGVFSWTVASGSSSGTTWTESIDVSDYTRFGAGLYRVKVTVSGAQTCTGSVLVNVDGNPLTTVGGIAGVGMVGIGAAATVRGVLRARRPR